MKGVVRAERLIDPEYYIAGLILRADTDSLRGIYKIDSWNDHEDFLEQLAKKGGRLLKGGEPDKSTAAKMVLQDWQRGRIPYYSYPPNYDTSRRMRREDEVDAFQNQFDDPTQLAREEREIDGRHTSNDSKVPNDVKGQE